jgi:dTDP-4-dehydrorhamnose 3,5-epimerase
MEVVRTAFPEVIVIIPARHGDHRGYFSETYNRRAMAAAGIAVDFVQDNQSLSADRGTVRGLHFQIPPVAQDKLLRVIRGALLDVAVDIRIGSPSFGRHVTARLSASGGEQIFIPAGFAHGFCTLEPDTEVLYKVSDYYSQPHERALLWCDPALAIDWPVTPGAAVLSDKDGRAPALERIEPWFRYDEAGDKAGG